MRLGALLQHGAIRTRLEQNRLRRDRAAAETEAARAELAELIRRGRKLNPPLTVSEMARLANIRRERAHELLRGVDRRDRHVYKNEGSTE